jgi:two-component system CheB/CheR fusion protein
MDQLTIVGIGASAGGLQAFEEFFSALPVECGLAFVLVAHLAPDHVSLLPELIGKKSPMPVVQATDGVRVAPNHVYVIPPNKEMTIFNGTLQLLELSKPRGSNLPIDIFLRSLAQDQATRAIGIILSGTGTDGTLGIRAIKGEAGMVMAQDPESAKYDGMPKSAIASGLVDFVLSPGQMPEQLLNYVRHQHGKIGKTLLAGEQNIENELGKVFSLLRTATHHDFSVYKRNTIHRRIERRMHVQQIDHLADYVRYLQSSERETGILFKELLIGVTSFFRDPEAFELLKSTYLRELLKELPDDSEVIRAWVAGCSTGEEAYSVAMIIAECMAELGRHLPVQIFGTDLDEEAIKVARTGLYPEAIAADISPQRLHKFFTKINNQYRINKNIREMVVFAPQNITRDPPFTKLDLLCCRNLLIYFTPELQKKLLPIFHYSLKENGLLFLGPSETIGPATDLFARLDNKWKIFRRLETVRAGHTVLALPTSRPALVATPPSKAPPISPPFHDANTLKMVKAILAQSDVPACVVIDDASDITYIHGQTGRFLEPAEGEASINLLAMARPGLKTGLLSAIRKTATNRRDSQVKGLQVRNNGGYLTVNLMVKPLPDFKTGQPGMMLVFFEEDPAAKNKDSTKPSRAALRKKSDEVKDLEEELQFTRENLQTSIEALQTSNEELKSSNEELQSTNEELQSTNEELETSREELQSLNEESITVNTELQNRIDELVTANDDIKNLLESTEVATIFLDIRCNIKRFTAKATTIFPLTAADIGRPVNHFTSTLKDVDLQQSAAKVLADLDKQVVEVAATDGKIYRMVLRPYRTSNNMIDGIVVTLEDITEWRQLLDQAQRLAAIVKDSNDAITLQDTQGNIIAWNGGAEKLYGYAEAEALGMNIKELAPRERREEVKALRDNLKGDGANSFVTERLCKNGEVVKVWLTVTRLPDEKGRTAFIATTERDLRKLNPETLRKLR